jgi:hypothetical protein
MKSLANPYSLKKGEACVVDKDRGRLQEIHKNKHEGERREKHGEGNS